MDIIRIPISYYTQIEYMQDKDIVYVMKTVFQLCSWIDIIVEKSLRWGLVISIYREALQMENKTRAKKWLKALKIDTATLMGHTVSSLKSENLQPSNIKSSQVTSSQSIEDFEKPEIENIKHKYWEYKHILLTDTQKEKLILDIWENDFDYYLKKVDEYVQTSWKKYKDHNLVIRRFRTRDKWNDIKKYDFKNMSKNEIVDLRIETKGKIQPQLRKYDMYLNAIIESTAKIKGYY